MALTGTYRKTNPSSGKNIPLDEYYDLQQNRSQWKVLKLGKVNLPVKGTKRILHFVLIGVGILSIMGLASSYQQHMACKDMQIVVHAEEDQAFLSKEDVKMLVEMEYGRELIGEKFSKINLATVEAGLEEVPFIKDAEVYKTVTGVLNLQVWMKEPIARVVNNSGSYLYLDKWGHKFPTSSQQTAHVMLIRGDIDEKLMPVDTLRKEALQASLPVLNYIYHHDFWNAQISEIIVKDNGDLILHPQIGDMDIEFGKPDQIKEKFERLTLFYHKVIENVGWDHYGFISVKYKHQVIAKK